MWNNTTSINKSCIATYNRAMSSCYSKYELQNNFSSKNISCCAEDLARDLIYYYYLYFSGRGNIPTTSG